MCARDCALEWRSRRQAVCWLIPMSGFTPWILALRSSHHTSSYASANLRAISTLPCRTHFPLDTSWTQCRKTILSIWPYALPLCGGAWPILVPGSLVSMEMCLLWQKILGKLGEKAAFPAQFPVVTPGDFDCCWMRRIVFDPPPAPAQSRAGICQHPAGSGPKSANLASRRSLPAPFSAEKGRSVTSRRRSLARRRPASIYGIRWRSLTRPQVEEVGWPPGQCEDLFKGDGNSYSPNRCARYP